MKTKTGAPNPKQPTPAGIGRRRLMKSSLWPSAAQEKCSIWPRFAIESIMIQPHGFSHCLTEVLDVLPLWLQAEQALNAAKRFTLGNKIAAVH
jgi:hypothetical protein